MWRQRRQNLRRAGVFADECRHAESGQGDDLIGGGDRSGKHDDGNQPRPGPADVGHQIQRGAVERQIHQRQVDPRGVVGGGHPDRGCRAGHDGFVASLGQRSRKTVAHGGRLVRDKDRLDRHEGVSRYNRLRSGSQRRVYGYLPRMRRGNRD